MKVSIRWKILFFFITLILVGLTIETYFHIQNQIEGRTEELQSRAVAMGKVIGLNFANPLLTGSSLSEDLKTRVRVWLGETDDAEFLIVYDRHGDPIFENRSGPLIDKLDLSLPKDSFDRAMGSNVDFIGRKLIHAGEPIYDVLVPLQLLHTDFGLVRMGFDISRLHEERTQIIINNAIIGSVLLMLAGLLSIITTNWLVRPIHTLVDTAAQIGGNKLDARADIQSGDEIEELAEQFNTMADRLENRIHDLEKIEELNREISTELRPEHLHDHIIHTLYESWDIPYLGLILDNPDEDRLELKAGIRVQYPYYQSAGDDDPVKDLLAGIEEPYEKFGSRKSLNLLEQIFEGESGFLTEAAVFPLKTDSADLGYLLLGHKDQEFERRTIQLILTLTYQIKITIENANHYTRAVTDDLTGLYTRRFYDLQLQQELERDGEIPVSLAMIDIDDFKSYNDTYGHPAGDDVLINLAETFENQVRTADTQEAERRPDTVARYGGEEFGIILPETDLESAVSVCQRIVDAVADIDQFERQITISVGIAEARPGETSQSLITRADQALYRAKSEGKNQVCVSET